jgi:hypothetical protein
MLRKFGLLAKFADMVHGLQFGFNLGVTSPVLTTHIPSNHSSTTDNPSAILLYINTKMHARRYSSPYNPAKLEALIGPFWTSPLGCILKANGTPCTIQDLSFGSALHPAGNMDIDSRDFLCKWGTFAIMYLLVLFAPLGSEAATLDMDAAYHRCPICANQQHHFVVSWGSKIFVNHCIAFGGASLAGVFGQVANTFLAICCTQGWLPCTKWVDDFVFIWHPLGMASPASLDFAFGLEAILQLGLDLGWPWKALKTKPFSQVFQYLGFQ